MLLFEWLACVYFAGVAVSAPWTGVSRRVRLRTALCAAVVVAVIVFISRLAGETVRAWAPHLYLILGYWMPAWLVRPPERATPLERRLIASDAAIRPRLPAVAAPLQPMVELAYLLCYPLVPASFLVVWLRGGSQDVIRFWAAVLASGYICYGSLPWLISRPPRAVDGSSNDRVLGGANAYVLARVSHQLNTFPSGHVAVSFAAAAACVPVSARAGAIIAAVAGAVAVGAAAGRYHYVVDVVAGVLVAAGTVAIARWVS